MTRPGSPMLVGGLVVAAAFAMSACRGRQDQMTAPKAPLERAPFDAESSAEILTQQVKELPPPPKEGWAEIPAALEQLILAMLEKTPADRPAMPR